MGVGGSSSQEGGGTLEMGWGPSEGELKNASAVIKRPG